MDSIVDPIWSEHILAITADPSHASLVRHVSAMIEQVRQMNRSVQAAELKRIGASLFEIGYRPDRCQQAAASAAASPKSGRDRRMGPRIYRRDQKRSAVPLALRAATARCAGPQGRRMAKPDPQVRRAGALRRLTAQLPAADYIGARKKNPASRSLFSCFFQIFRATVMLHSQIAPYDGFLPIELCKTPNGENHFCNFIISELIL